MDVKKMASMGQKAMRKKQSAAEKVFWPLQAGRPRQVKPGLLEAVHLGRTAANRFYASVTEAGMDLKAVTPVCHLICVTKDGKQLGGMYPFHPEDQDRNDLKMALWVFKHKVDPMGLVFFLKDLEKNNHLVHARVFEPKYAHLVKLLGWEAQHTMKIARTWEGNK